MDRGLLDLPDELLVGILSHLSPEELCQARKISSRFARLGSEADWRRVWKHVRTEGQGPTPRFGASATACDRYVVVFGGSETYTKFSSDVWILELHDQVCGTWRKLDAFGDIPTPRRSHTAVAIGKHVYIFGGVWEGRTPTKAEEASAKHQRLQGSYGFYGRKEPKVDGRRDERLNDLYRLDVETGEWARVEATGKVPAPRNGHSMTAVGDLIFVIGGYVNCIHRNDVFVFDTRRCEWEQRSPTGSFLAPRHGHTAVAFGDQLLLFGGTTDRDGWRADLYLYSVPLDAWALVSATGEAPGARTNHVGLRVGRRALLVMGAAPYADGRGDGFLLNLETGVWRRAALPGAPLHSLLAEAAVAVEAAGLVVAFGCEDNKNAFLSGPYAVPAATLEALASAPGPAPAPDAAAAAVAVAEL
eukprot:tig00000241_g20963.t1